MLARLALLSTLLVLPAAVLAEEPPKPPAAAMPCTGPGDKGCCGGACMETQAGAADGKAKPSEADCPCKRAAKAAAAKAAGTATQAPQ